jgi:hypothetical protein
MPRRKEPDYVPNPDMLDNASDILGRAMTASLDDPWQPMRTIRSSVGAREHSESDEGYDRDGDDIW